MGEFGAIYNASEYRLKEWLKNGDITPLGLEGKPDGVAIDDLMIDIADPKHKKLLEEYNKLVPVPSKKYYKKENTSGRSFGPIMVPVGYLAKLGFGDAKELARMVQNEKLPGKLKRETVDGKTRITGAYVDIDPYIESEEKLKRSREANHNIIELNQFAKNFNIKVADLKRAILDGEAKIISEYIFYDDSRKVFINLKDEKNQKFIDKILLGQAIEREVLLAQRAARAEEVRNLRPIYDNAQSLRMKIVHHLCPLTREVASQEARKDGYVSSILKKSDKEGEESLSNQEVVSLGKYRREYWLKAGTVEFEKAHASASIILEQFKKDGIDAVCDPEIRAIIEKHYSDA